MQNTTTNKENRTEKKELHRMITTTITLSASGQRKDIRPLRSHLTEVALVFVSHVYQIILADVENNNDLFSCPKFRFSVSKNLLFSFFFIFYVYLSHSNNQLCRNQNGVLCVTRFTGEKKYIRHHGDSITTPPSKLYRNC